MQTQEHIREAFWAQPKLPPGLVLTREQTIAAPRRGPGGHTLVDLARLEGPGERIWFVLIARPRILAREVHALRDLLNHAADAFARRMEVVGSPSLRPHPGLITDSARPSVIEACRVAGVSVFDTTGTAIVHTPPFFVHVLGSQRPPESTRQPAIWTGKAARLIHSFLLTPRRPRTIQALSLECEVSYAYAYSTIQGLERTGLVVRISRQAGFMVADPAALLKAWLDSGARTWVSIEPYNAPSTRPSDLQRASEACVSSGAETIFTFASGLQPTELFVAGLPHGAYLSGNEAPLAQALGLRRITPHNFLIVRPHPTLGGGVGGVFTGARDLPWGRGVSLPQLALDFASAPGRGKEQADHLVSVYGEAHPVEVVA